jgi:poly-gamma-glutamate capsule biosynthesis protein CapA/YwtB (metallophosphatase superfamily)
MIVGMVASASGVRRAMRSAMAVVLGAGWLLGACSGNEARRTPVTPAEERVAIVEPLERGASDAGGASSDGAVATGAGRVAIETGRDRDGDGAFDEIDLAFAGDVMFGRYVDKGFRAIEAEKFNPFVRVAALLDSDFTIVNLETPILRDPPKKSPWGTNKRFVTTPARVATLKLANVDAVTLANNHAYDMHKKGIAQTPLLLEEIGLGYIGAHRPEPPKLRAETVEIGGWRIGYIAATTERNGDQRKGEPELPHAERNRIQRELLPVVREARETHDLVIVVLHWGAEYEDVPERWQTKAARAYIDAGADAVIAHHPHVLQGIERYKHGLIAYSLGNFLFDNLHHTKRLHGVLHVRFRRDGRCLAEASYHPTVGTRPRYAPAPAGKDFKRVAGRLRELSKKKPLLRTEWTIDGDRLVVEGACKGQGAGGAGSAGNGGS